MNSEELLGRLKEKFPKVEQLQPGVKAYATFRLPAAAELSQVAAWLKEEAGFAYLDMVTAVDCIGPVDPKGFIADPNPNVFLPEGATPQVEAPVKSPGFGYRDSIELVYLFSNLSERLKIVLKADVPRDEPRVPSLCFLYKTADWQEREAYDLLGVRFENHPNLVKILTPDFIQGHPLRKDYAHVKDRFD